MSPFLHNIHTYFTLWVISLHLLVIILHNFLKRRFILLLQVVQRASVSCTGTVYRTERALESGLTSPSATLTDDTDSCRSVDFCRTNLKNQSSWFQFQCCVSVPRLHGILLVCGQQWTGETRNQDPTGNYTDRLQQSWYSCIFESTLRKKEDLSE